MYKSEERNKSGQESTKMTKRKQKCSGGKKGIKVIRKVQKGLREISNVQSRQE